MSTGRWPRCPHVSDRGYGQCILLDLSATHTVGAESRHVFGRTANTAPTSARDRGRWAHQQAGLPACPRRRSSDGTPCVLPDISGAHLDGHIPAPAATYPWTWATDTEDMNRWRLTNHDTVLVGALGLPEVDVSLPRPAGWEPRRGDYVFAWMPSVRDGRPPVTGDDPPPAALRAARDQVVQYGRTISSAGHVVELDSGQRVAWFRTVARLR